MKLYWTSNGIPHGYLCDTPIHLIYRLRDCGPVGQLRETAQEFACQLKDLRKLGTASSEQIQVLLEEQMKVFDALLDAQDQSKYLLKHNHAADAVVASWLKLRDMSACKLYALCVMGNHVHVLLAGAPGIEDSPLGFVVRRHKTFTNTEIKRLLDLDTEVWDTGYFDRYVREGSFMAVLAYILNNPVKARLVTHWQAWTATWVDPRCITAANKLGLLL